MSSAAPLYSVLDLATNMPHQCTPHAQWIAEHAAWRLQGQEEVPAHWHSGAALNCNCSTLQPT